MRRAAFGIACLYALATPTVQAQDSAEVEEPTEPSELGEPLEPVEPVEPDPTDPTDPNGPKEPEEPEEPGHAVPKDPNAPLEPFKPSDPFPAPPGSEVHAEGRLDLVLELGTILRVATPVVLADGVDPARLRLMLRTPHPLVGLRVEWEISGSGNRISYADAAVRGLHAPGDKRRPTAEVRAEFTSVVPEMKTVTVTLSRGATERVTFTGVVEFRPLTPVVDAVAPTGGPLTGGNTVTIRGTRLAAAGSPPRVWFGASEAQVLAATATELSVVAPPAASFGPVDVRVTVDGATATAPAAYVYRLVSTDTCTFIPETDRSLRLADVNGDRRLDFVLTGDAPVFRDGVRIALLPALGVVLNGGDGARILPVRWTFLSDDFAVGATTLAMGDFNSDGRLDAAVGVRGTGITEPLLLLMGRGDGFFDPPTAHVAGGGSNEFLFDMATGAFDAGFTTDLAVATRSGVDVFRTQLKGAPPLRATYGSDSSLAVEAADVTGDGTLDLVSLGVDGVRVFTGRGDGTFTAGSLFSVGWSPRGLAVGDLDGDGFPDVVIAERIDGQLHYTGHLRVYRNDGAGNFSSAPFELSVPDLGTSVAVGELTGDGALDLAVFAGSDSPFDATLRLVPGNGDGTLGEPVVLASTDSAGTVIAADVTRDGRADVVAKHDGGLCVHPATAP